MKEIDYYSKTETPYPFEKNYVSFQVNSISKGDIVHKDITEKQLIELGLKTISKLDKTSVQGDFVVIYKFDKESYEADMKTHSVEINDKEVEFRHDLAVGNGLDPKSSVAIVIYSEAYERGHSSGRSEVASCYSSIAYFAKELFEAKEKDAKVKLC